MPDEAIDALSTMIGWDPIKALGEYHHEWMRKKTAGRAAVGIVAAASFLVAGLLGEPAANVGTPSVGYSVDKLYIMRRLVAKMRQRAKSLMQLMTRSEAAPSVVRYATPCRRGV